MTKKEQYLDIKKSVIFILISSVSFSMMTLFVKLASTRTTIDIIILFRFTISFLYALLFLLVRKILKQTISLKTNHIFIHIARAISSMLSMVLLYTALRYIPLVDGNLLLMTNALFVPILGTLFLKYRVHYKHWLAITIGFIGIAFILRPGHELFYPPSLLAFLSGILSAITLLLLRKQSKFDEHYVCMFYYFFIAFLASSVYALFTWITPDFYTFLLLIGVGVFGSFYQDFLIRASAYASPKITSSLLYSTLIFSIVFDWLFFQSIPRFYTWIGIVLVIFSSIMTIYVAKPKRMIK
jgi:drug/metabolite transporter (DMT)-like permease